MIRLRNPHMTVASPQNLKPRKTPRQARAEATVDAIFEGDHSGFAQRGRRSLDDHAGRREGGRVGGHDVSVFPHKAALLYAVGRSDIRRLPRTQELCRGAAPLDIWSIWAVPGAE
jgi:hypothetical protein